MRKKETKETYSERGRKKVIARKTEREREKNEKCYSERRRKKLNEKQRNL